MHLVSVFVPLLLVVPLLPAQSTIFTINGGAAGDSVGVSASGAGDVDGDGVNDFIVGTPFDDNNGSNSGSAQVYSGQLGTILYSFDGDSAGDLFGAAVSGAGDVDADGYADLIVGAQLDDNNGANSGSARVFSGKDGSVLYTFDGDSAGDQLGASVSSAGKVNVDANNDLIVGAPGDDNNGSNSGSARVFSGVDGSILYTFDGDSAGDQFGFSVSGAGKVNAGPERDCIVGAPGDDNNGSGSGSARVFSGVDGSIIYTFDGDSPGDAFGGAVSSAANIDGDAFVDLVVGAYLDDNGSAGSGSVRVFAGIDGSVLYTFNGDAESDGMGWSVKSAGDVNADGRTDIIAGAWRVDTPALEAGSARVYSGLDGSIIFTVEGEDEGDSMGWSVSGMGDINGDGNADLLVGLRGDDPNGDGSGSVRVVSGDALTFTSDVSTVSLASGGTQNLFLDAGVAHADAAYAVLESLGTSPGFVFGVDTIPLNPDVWFWVTVSNISNPGGFTNPYENPFVDYSGFLDAGGSAVASFTLHDSGVRHPDLNDPALIGITFWKAYVVHHLVFGIEHISNVLPMTITP